MNVQTLAGSLRNERGGRQVSRLLLTAGQFGSRQLSVTWVECQPGSQQALHAHPAQEQAYVIVHGRGRMVAGAEGWEVGPGTLVFVPPATPHAIRTIGEQLVYVSATSPPFEATITGQTWEIPRVKL